MYRRALLAAMVTTTAGCSAFATDRALASTDADPAPSGAWPQYRGDSGKTGHAPGPELADTLAQYWETEVDRGRVAVPPRVRDDRLVYATTRDASFVVADLTSGAERRRIALDGFPNGIAIGDGRAFLTHGGTVSAVGLDDGAVDWETDVGIDLSSPTLAGDAVFVGNESGTGAVSALDAEDGTVRWSVEAETLTGPPAVTGGRAAVVETGGTVSLLDLASGSGETTVDLHAEMAAGPPIVAGDTVVAAGHISGQSRTRLVGVDPGSGDRIWSMDLPAATAGSLATDGESVYVAATDGSVRSVSTDGSVEWTVEEPNEDIGFGVQFSPVCTGEYLVRVAGDETLQYVDRATGSVEVSHGLPEPAAFAPILLGEYVLVVGAARLRLLGGEDAAGGE